MWPHGHCNHALAGVMRGDIRRSLALGNRFAHAVHACFCGSDAQMSLAPCSRFGSVHASRLRRPTQACKTDDEGRNYGRMDGRLEGGGRDKWMEGREGRAVERGNATGYGKGGKQGEGKGDG